MFNKKKIIIITLAVIIVLASVAAVFFLFKQTGGKNIISKPKFDFINDLKNNHQEISSAQLQFYKDTAAKGSIESCLGRDDESVCILSAAIIKGDRNLCHSLEPGNEKLFQECNNNVIKQKASIDITRCGSLSDNDYFNCLLNLFSIDNQPFNCTSLLDTETLEVCQSILNFKAAIDKYDRELCKTVKTQRLNQYCLKVIIDRNDIDGDGLSNLDEINKYKTNYQSADTDGDGINDGEAVRRGLIKPKQ